MTIPFSHIPANLRVPLFYAEIDPSQANTAVEPQRALIIGQMTSAGSFAPNVPVLCQSLSAAKAGAGAGSMIAGMVAAYLANDPTGELWVLPLADDGSGTAAAGTVTFSGPTTAAGVLSLYVAGQLIAITLLSGQTAAQVATTVAAAINAAIDLPVTAAAAASVVTLTAKHKGLASNDIDIRTNYLGAPGGEALPAGLGATIAAMSGGLTNPTLTTALSNLQETAFDFLISAYVDATSTTAITALLNDTTGRWAWTTQVYGHAFIAKRGTSTALSTFGSTLNDQHLSCMGFNDSPSPNWAWAAAYAGAAAVSLRNDPGLPLQTLAILGILAPPVQSRFVLTQRNVLLYDGISTFTVSRVGAIAIENIITTYELNASGQPDNSYLQVETLFLLMFVLRRLSSVVTAKYSRVKLAADGVRLVPGSNVVTPSVIKADLIANYRQMEAEGMVQQSDAFAKGLVVEKNAQNPNRVDVLYPAVLIGGLRIFALLAQFRLS